jgi:maltodextrin utilization protein YvdJ
MTITQLFTNKTKRPLLVASILSFFGFVFVACLIIIPITIHYQNANSFANKNYRIDGSN